MAAICSGSRFADWDSKISDGKRSWARQHGSVWRAHHEAWKRSELNQRQYCEAEGIPLKAFGNWRAQFIAEPQPPERKLLYRRRRLSPHASLPSSPVTYPCSHPERPIVARPRAGQRRRFTDSDNQRIADLFLTAHPATWLCPATGQPRSAST